VGLGGSINLGLIHKNCIYFSNKPYRTPPQTTWNNTSSIGPFLTVFVGDCVCVCVFVVLINPTLWGHFLIGIRSIINATELRFLEM